MIKPFYISLIILIIISSSCTHYTKITDYPEVQTTNVLLPQSVKDSVNCITSDYELPMRSSREDANVELEGILRKKELVVRLESAGSCHYIIRYEFEVTSVVQGTFPDSTISFHVLDYSQDGWMESKLIIPVGSSYKFFIESTESKNQILSMEYNPNQPSEVLRQPKN